VLAVEPAGLDSSNEELRAVRVRSRVRHGQKVWLSVFELEVFIGKLRAVDRFASGAIAVSEIASLEHEFGDYAVKLGALVPKPLVTGAEGTEILSSFWDDIVVKTEVNAAGATFDFIFSTDLVTIRVAPNKWPCPGDIEITANNHFDL